MRMSFRPLAASVMLAGLYQSTAFAEETIKTGRLYNVAALDVAGIRLGMSPAMVQQALNGSGYELAKQERAIDFPGRVQWRAMERRGEDIGPRTPFSRDIGSESYTGPSSQEIGVEYQPTPSGMRVSRVTYRVELDYLEEGMFVGTLERKYGRPSEIYHYFTARPQTYTYCDTLNPRCGPDRPQLTAVVITPFGFKKHRTITLEQGRIANDAYLAAIEAAVDKAEPKVRAPQF